MMPPEIEQAIDRRVQRRLATDRGYRHAENAEQQAQREEQITREVERELCLEKAEPGGRSRRDPSQRASGLLDQPPPTRARQSRARTGGDG